MIGVEKGIFSAKIISARSRNEIDNTPENELSMNPDSFSPRQLNSASLRGNENLVPSSVVSSNPVESEKSSITTSLNQTIIFSDEILNCPDNRDEFVFQLLSISPTFSNWALMLTGLVHLKLRDDAGP
jgi:hypothetical protein